MEAEIDRVAGRRLSQWMHLHDHRLLTRNLLPHKSRQVAVRVLG